MVINRFTREPQLIQKNESVADEKKNAFQRIASSVGKGVDLIKGIGQSILRSGASTTLTFANKPELSFPDDPELDSVVKRIFGETPKSLATRVAEAEVKLPAGEALPFSIKAPKELALPGILALTVLDFTGAGGESKVLSALAKANNTEDVLTILNKIKVTGKEAEDLAPALVKAKTTQEVESLLKSRKSAIKATKEAVETTAKESQIQTRTAQSIPGGPAQAGQLPTIPQIDSSLPGSIPPGQESVNKLVQALKEAKPLRGQQEKLYSAERGKRLGAVLGIREKALGEKGYFQELSKLKGELPKVEFESLREKIGQSDINNLFNMVAQSPRISDFEKVSAQGGLAKILGQAGGSVPTRSELQLLNRIFPEGVLSTLLEKRPLLTKIMEGLVDVLNIPRSIVSSVDLSAPFRQGVVLVSKPKQFASAFADMFKYFASEDAFKALQYNIESRPTYKIMRDSKLAIMDRGASLAGREERFLSNFAEKIPVAGRLIRASGRAYTGFLNKLRADVFDDLLAKATSLGLNKVDNPQLAKDLATFVNSATGRGSLGSLQKSTEVLNAVLFSPRLLMSRVNLLNPYYYYKLDPFVRKEAIKTMLTTSAMGLTVLGLAKAGGARVGSDPRSADFGKIKIGDTRIDISGGFQQYFKLGAQILSGEIISSTTGKTITLGEGYKPLTRLDIIERFFLGKENPIASFITSALQGQDVIGQPFEAKREIINRFIPMIAQDAVDAMKEWGPGKGALLTIPGVFGFGVQTYDAKTAPGPKKINRFNK